VAAVGGGGLGGAALGLMIPWPAGGDHAAVRSSSTGGGSWKFVATVVWQVLIFPLPFSSALPNFTHTSLGRGWPALVMAAEPGGVE